MRHKGKPRVLLLACGRYLGISYLPAALARGGCSVDLIARRGEWCARSRYLHNRWIVEEDGADFCRRAHEIVGDGDEYDLVIPCDNGVLKGLAALAHEPWARRFLPFELGNYPPEMIYSKIPFCRIAEEWGLPIVPHAVIRDGADIAGAVESLGFPMIIKPPALSAGRGIWIAQSREDLERRFERGEMDLPSIAQRFVTGQISGMVCLIIKGRPVGWIGLHKYHTNPKPFGPTSVTQQFMHPLIETIVHRFAEKTNYNGFATMDFAFEPDWSRLHIIEATLRPVPMVYLGETLDAPFCRALAATLRGEEFEWEFPRVDHLGGKRAAVFPQELLRGLDHNRPDWMIASMLRPSFWRGLPPPDWPIIASHLGLMGSAVLEKCGHLARKFTRRVRKPEAAA